MKEKVRNGEEMESKPEKTWRIAWKERRMGKKQTKNGKQFERKGTIEIMTNGKISYLSLLILGMQHGETLQEKFSVLDQIA